MISVIPRKGDWISFYRNGQVAIEEVTHVRADPRPQNTECFTKSGSVVMPGILELRRKAEE